MLILSPLRMLSLGKRSLLFLHRCSLNAFRVLEKGVQSRYLLPNPRMGMNIPFPARQMTRYAIIYTVAVCDEVHGLTSLMQKSLL